jgi:hypothetical protein
MKQEFLCGGRSFGIEHGEDTQSKISLIGQEGREYSVSVFDAFGNKLSGITLNEKIKMISVPVGGMLHICRK